MVSRFYDVGSSSRYGGSRHIAPDLASTSPSRHLLCTESGLVPRLLATSSRTDIIPDLLTCNNPWNAIGDVLDLPPIPSADATYFSNIPSFKALRLSSRASSSLGQVDMRGPLSPARHEATRSRTVHSDGDVLLRPDSPQHSFAREAIRRASSPLVSRDPPTKTDFSPALPFCSSLEARILSPVEPHQLSPSPSESISIPSEAPRSVLVSWTRSPSPRTPDGKSGLGSKSSPALVKTLSPHPSILTPLRSTSAPKNLNLPDTYVPHSPGIASRPCDAIIEFDPATLMSKVPITRATALREQRPRLECPDLFQDEEDSLTGIF
jgi:hypothetical protein